MRIQLQHLVLSTKCLTSSRQEWSIFYAVSVSERDPIPSICWFRTFFPFPLGLFVSLRQYSSLLLPSKACLSFHQISWESSARHLVDYEQSANEQIQEILLGKKMVCFSMLWINHTNQDTAGNVYKYKLNFHATYFQARRNRMGVNVVAITKYLQSRIKYAHSAVTQ